jgi:hypothetical protein
MKVKHAGKGFNSLKDCPFDHQITTLAYVIFFFLVQNMQPILMITITNRTC